MSSRLIFVVGLVAVIALAAFFIFNGARDELSRKTDLGDVAVTAAGEWIYAQMTQAAFTPTVGAPQLSAAEVLATSMAEERRLAATQQFQEQQDEQRALATQEAQEAEQRYQATATAEYWHGLAWQATQTQAWVMAATAAPATQVAFAWTQTAIPMLATAEANRINAQQTVVVGQAMQVEMAVSRQRWAGVGNTLVMWFVMVAAIGITGYFVWQMKRVRKLTPDGRVHLLDNGKAGQQVIASDLMYAPVITVFQDGQVAASGAGMDQAQVTERAQKVRALEAVARASQPPKQPFDLVGEIMAGQNGRYAVSDPPADLVSPDALSVLDADWKDRP